MHGKAVTTMETKTLADWLLEEIEQRKLSIREFGRAAGIGQATLSAILNGDGYPSVTTLIRLTQYTGVDICSLMALIAPSESHIDAEVTLLVERIKRLPPEKQVIIETYLIGLMLQERNQTPDT